jgi:hypothetical protein
MTQLELFDYKDDIKFAMTLTMDFLRQLHKKDPVTAKYFYNLRFNERDRIYKQVERAMFCAKIDGFEFSKITHRVLIP